MTQDRKDQDLYIANELRNHNPHLYNKYYDGWVSVGAQNVKVSADQKIDWTKPLKCVHPKVFKVEYYQSIDNGNFCRTHICKLYYNNRGDRWYYRIYYSNGKSADVCAEDISIVNDVEVWGKSAWMVLDRIGRVVSIKHATRQAAEIHTAAYDAGKTWLEPFQYIRYDYTEQR